MTSPPHPGPRAAAPSGPQPVLPFAPHSAGSSGPAIDRPASPRPDRTRRAETPALARLLEDLGPQLRRGVPPQDEAGACATGIERLDRLLGGGFPRGRLCEIAGPEGGGRTSLLLAWLARLTAVGEQAAWVDLADAFDPPSAAAAGVDLERVLWVRPPDASSALRAAEHVLGAGGFAGVVLDLTPAAGAGAREGSARVRSAAADGPAPPAPGARPRRRERDGAVVPASAWPRLRRAAAATRTALVVTARVRIAGTFADLALETGRGRARFAEGPAWLEGLEAPVRLVRRRGGPEGRAAPLSWNTAA
jgi:RecA/RadA recombinase